jgi:hypothetical protein
MEKRVVPIATGHVAIEYSGSGWGEVEVYDADGWKVRSAVWGMQGYAETPAEILAAQTSLTDSDARRIADKTNDQFRQRGGDSRARTRRLAKEGRILVAGLGGGLLVAFALGAVAGSLVF